MQTLDWILVVTYLILLMVISSVIGRRANKGVDEFFIAGRSLPWWMLGTAMVATAFASDTPLFITKLVRQYGISGAWYYWNASLNGIIGAFMIAHLWRRTRGVTDAEFRELRYSGRVGRSVRVLWAMYWSSMGMFFTSAWVLLAMVKIGKAVLGLPPEVTWLGMTFDPSILLTVAGCVVAFVYTAVAGLWGDIIADLIQFAVAFFGTSLLGILALREVGGLSALKEKIAHLPNAGPSFFDLLPHAGSDVLVVFVVGMTLQWWSSAWSDSGMFVAQRCMAAKSEKQAQIGRYFGIFSQMAVIVWPWAITALCSLVIFPADKFPEIAADPELAYPRMVLAIMPTGLRGLMVIAFVSAFMSAINSVVNSNATYLVNDIYRRHLVKDASPRHYVWIGRAWMVVVLCVGGYTAAHSTSILSLSQLVVQFTGGVGGVFLLRWFWWRVNAWTEITAYLASAAAGLGLNVPALRSGLHDVLSAITPNSMHSGLDHFFTVSLQGSEAWAYKLIIVVAATMAISMLVMWLTPPTEREHLYAFCRKVRPYGPGWARIRREMGDQAWEPDGRFDWKMLVVGAVLFYSVWACLGLLWTGHFIGSALGAVSIALSGRYLYVKWSKMPEGED